jgi:mannose/fructose/N-acetylgalactosamine-specific phosphotransferase system component IIC
MMGMNLVMVGSFMTGISALRRRLLAAWLAWLFVLVAPSVVAMSLTLLPTTPSGGLWIFSLMMIALGYSLRFGRPSYLAA